MRTIRNTYQKELVLSDVMNRYDHPTAQMVFESLVVNNPEIGIATVYRNLNSQVESGKLTTIITKDNITHYDYNRDDHCHLVCTKCHEIIDIPTTNFIDLDYLKEQYGFEVDKQNVILYGICKKCQK